MSDAFLREMLVASKLSPSDLNRLLISAPKRYKVYSIVKSNGGKRVIAHPSRELKVLQYLLLKKFLVDLPVHPNASAYVRGIGLRDNAIKHVGKRFLIKLDFEEFFPSLKVADWQRYRSLKKSKIQMDLEDSGAVEQILFWGKGGLAPNCLSIGAPTSPIISNALMFNFDTKVTKLTMPLSVGYTRYADDITISSNDLDELRFVEKNIERIIARQQWPRLKLHSNKRGIYSKGVRQMVTGLILTPNGSVSIGRDRKRLIHAMIFNFKRDRLSSEDKKKLQGLVGFAIACEQAFVKKLENKYGADTMRRIKQLG